MWQRNIEWDKPLDKPLTDKWNNIANDIQEAVKVTISRRYFHHDNDTNTPQLHTFADASTKAYGAIVYIQQGNETSFVIAKTRVAPLKQLTLPKLQLMAAVVATRLAKFVTASFSGHYDSMLVHLWSDSQIVLHWIHSQKKLKQFILHHVQEINQTFPTAVWHYCSTGDNPADLLTRGTNCKVFTNSLWIQGPSWLTEESKWPKWSRTKILHLQIEATADSGESDLTEETTQSTGIHNVIEVSKYSTLTKLLHVTGYILRFIMNIQNPASKQTGPLSIKELNRAQFTWIFSYQQERFSQEVATSKSKSINTRRLPLVRQLQLYLDEAGYLRCGGRIHNAPVNETTKFPYLLPSRHPLIMLIVLATHATQLHGGVNSTVTALM